MNRIQKLLNALINKPTTATGAQMTNCFIKATLLNDFSITAQ